MVMEPLENTNGLGQSHSMSDSFSLYERYMRSFNIVVSSKEKDIQEINGRVSPSDSYCENSVIRGNIDLSTAQSDAKHKHCHQAEADLNQNTSDKLYCEGAEAEVDYQSNSPAVESLDNSSATADHSHLTEKSNQTGSLLVSSEEYKRESIKPPLFLTSTMENSNNAVDSVTVFRDVRHTESVFKLPNIELSFNGTIKHVQKLTDIVDPISVLSSQNLGIQDQNETESQNFESNTENSCDQKTSDIEDRSVDVEALEKSESTGDYIYEDSNLKKCLIEEESSTKWNLNQSHSSFDASFDSGVRSPDMFSDAEADIGDDAQIAKEPAPLWSFIKNHEAFDKKRIKKLEENLQGILPPPSVTIIKTDVSEMLKKYYNYLPLFNETETPKLNVSEEENCTTPTKRVSFIEIPQIQETSRNAEDVVSSLNDTKTDDINDTIPNIHSNNAVTIESSSKAVHPDNSKHDSNASVIRSNPVSNFLKHDENCTYFGLNDSKHEANHSKLGINDSKIDLNETSGLRLNNSDLDTSLADKSIELKMCTEIETIESTWPELLKCRHHDVYYNITKFSEKMELLTLKLGERYVGAETDTSVNVHSGGFQSPSSASKRKALRLKLAQAKSPGRRLSHLARRRQAFCSAATINEKAQASNSRMVLIDKKKLINSSERKSPKFRRTPGKKTPNRKTPRKTPAKTPRSGGSSRKKAMRRLLMDSETVTRTQPSRETLKRALFISPENRKSIPLAPCSSVPANAMRTKRALFGSPIRDTKSSDGTQSDHFLKRKRDSLDDIPESNRSKIAKSLSFDDTFRTSQRVALSRRASEVFAGKRTADMNDHHKQKLLWAVSEALRVHGWRMSSPGFREKASNLARLTRRLLTLPPYSSQMAAANLCTSEYLLKIARKYVFAIIQGRSVDDCFDEEQAKLANVDTKITGYISANAYQQLKSRQTASTSFNPIKENSCSSICKLEPKSGTKNVLQDKLINIDSNSSGCSLFDKADLGIFKSNSMPSFEEAAKIRARRQISFDNVDFPKR